MTTLLKLPSSFDHANPARSKKYSEQVIKTNKLIIWDVYKSLVYYSHTQHDMNTSFDGVKFVNLRPLYVTDMRRLEPEVKMSFCL